MSVRPLAWQSAAFLGSVLAAVLLAGTTHRQSAGDENLKSPPARQSAASQARSPRGAADSRTFEEQVRPFLASHCVKCHGSRTAEAGLRLDTLAADFLDRPTADHWVEVLDRINLGEMPPDTEPRPEAETLTRTADWITAELQHMRRQAQSTGGQVLLRRLTRREYANTVADLLDVSFVDGEGPLEWLPPDGTMAGFDRVGKGLLLDPSLMEAYLTVAQRVVDRAVVFRPPAVPQRTLRFEFEQTPNSAMAYIVQGRAAELDDGWLVIMESAARTFGKIRHPYSGKEIPVTGRYRVRVRAAADRGTRGEPVFMDVTYGAAGRQARFRVDAAKDAPQVYEFEKTFDAFTPGEFNVEIVNGTRFTEGNAEWYHLQGVLNGLAESGNALESTRMKARMRAEGAYGDYVRGSYLPTVLHLDTLPKLYLDWIELVGPLQGEYPPRSMTTIFGDTEVAARFSGSADRQRCLQDARAIFTRLLPRAFRKPVNAASVQALVDLVDKELQAGAEPKDAIKAGLVALLCSPEFLLLAEPSPQDKPRRLNDHELASRLSYFLWSTMPDAELMRLADAGRLQNRDELNRQINRLMADPKVEGFVSGFARQWLKVDEFGRFAPDQQIFPGYYATDMAGLDEDVKEEPLAFFREVLRRDAPIISFLDSDWLMLNERLAKHYGIEGVEGPQFRRVDLRNGNPVSATRRRGGLLGMAGIHLWGADGNRTKPVERGKYLLTVLFNDPPAPPPPNAGEVEPNLRGENLTVRERLARHREQTTCNNCHRRIDPYGMAMENFNVIGQWRDRLDGEKPLSHWGNNRPPIDASGTLPSGRRFADFLEFKQAIVDQQDRFLRALTEKLFTYALGRTVEPADRPTIDQIVDIMTRDDDRTLRRALKEIATSEPFLTK